MKKSVTFQEKRDVAGFLLCNLTEKQIEIASP